MDHNPFKSIEKSLKEILDLHKVCKDVFHDVKNVSKQRENNYDFHEFHELDLFESCDKENTNESEKISSHLYLQKADLILKILMKKLDNQRKAVYDEFMDLLHNMSEEINAVSSVCSFIEHWDKNVLNDLKLKEYPSMFKKCFDKIPEVTRNEVGNLLSEIKKFNVDESINVLNESNKMNQLDMSIISSNFGQSVPALFDNNKLNLTESLCEDLKKIIPSNNLNYKPTDSDIIGLSVLDYSSCKILTDSTEDYCNEASKSTNNEKLHFDISNFDVKNSEDLSQSISSNDPLNQVLKDEKPQIYVDPDCSKAGTCRSFCEKHGYELPSFLNDSTRIPEIEYFQPYNESYDVDLSSIEESYCPIREDDALAIEKSCSNSYCDMDKSVSMGQLDISTIDFNYSFNNSNINRNHEKYLNLGKKD